MAKVLVDIRTFGISLFLAFHGMATKAFLAFSIFLSTTFFVNSVFAYASPGDRDGFVNDFASMLSQDTEEQLETQLGELYAAQNNDVVVVTIASLRGEIIENYADRLFEEWGIQKRREASGVLLLVARDERQVRILVGDGLEDVLSEENAGVIIQQTIVPAFGNDDFNGGIAKGAQAIVVALENPASASAVSGSGSPWGIIIFVAVAVAIIVLGKMLRKNKGGSSGKSGRGSSSTSGTGATGKW